ncbi:MAG: exopolysaccharide biosynthesis protein [Paracoccaceae bacterium]
MRPTEAAGGGAPAGGRAPAARAAPEPPRRLSRLLREIAAGDGERVAFGALVDGLWDRGFAPLLILFAAPNILPVLPGSSIFFGMPLMLLAFQLLAGRPNVWLPGFVRARSVERAGFARLVERLVPYVERFERLARPRLWPASRRLAERVAGAAMLLMGVFLFLPISFANSMPAIAIIVLALALALSARDGLWLLVGLATAAVSAAIALGIIGAAGTVAISVVV